MAPLYELGDFVLDAGDRLLLREGERIALTPKAVDLLVALVESHGAAVDRQSLLTKVWGDTAVEEGTLSSHISLLRKTLGSGVIETIPKRGYRFIGAVGRRAAAPQAQRRLLAVLPFENLSGNRRHDSFSDGLTEEMISQLGRLNPSRLGVIARTSSMTYKATEKTIEQIGRELNVSHVVEGSVRRAGSRVRITAQLIEVADQAQVWSDTYEGDLADILALQSRVATAVASQIQIRLQVAPDQRQIIPAAYEALLKGRYLWNRRSDQDLYRSIQYFEEAAQASPDYAPAYVGIADCYLTLQDHGRLPVLEATTKARGFLAKAVALDPLLADAHISSGHASFHEFAWQAAERELRRGIDLNPNYAIGHYYYANYLVATGDVQHAIAEAEEAVRLDPLAPATQCNLASILWYAGDFDRSIAAGRKSIELNPEYSRAYEDIGRALEQSGAFAEAVAAFEKGLSIEENSGIRASLGYAYALSGDVASARATLVRLHDAAKSDYVSAFSFALVHIALGEKDDAFRWLDRAYEERSSALPFAWMNPRLKGLRDDARFGRLIRRVGI